MAFGRRKNNYDDFDDFDREYTAKDRDRDYEKNQRLYDAGKINAREKAYRDQIAFGNHQRWLEKKRYKR